MRKRTNTYWKRRFELLKAREVMLAESAREEIEEIYLLAMLQVEKDMAHWYMRFMDNAEIDSLQEAKRILTERELAELKWTVDDYIRHGRENDLDGHWLAALENASARKHISRLQALELQLRHAAETVHAKTDQLVGKSVADAYLDGYTHTAFEVQRGFRIGVNLDVVDERQLAQLIHKPWASDGKDFSARIWESRDKLVTKLHTELTQMAILGDGPDKAIKRISKDFDTSKSNAVRVVQTEHAAFAEKAREDCFNDLGVKEYIFLATLDTKTSEICQDMDGEVFKMADCEIGVTAPPMHPRCRSTKAPYFKDMETTRFARDAEGNTFEVSGDMTYQAWEAQHIGGGGETERKGKKVKRDHPEIKVNNKIVHSKAYADKFNTITDNEKLNANLLKSAKEILKHRDGTLLEDMYLLNIETGDIVFKNTQSSKKQLVQYTDAMKKAVRENRDKLITIHNHPKGMPPSAADINSQFKNGYKQGIVVTHDGKIFAYEVGEEFEIIKPSIYERTIGKYKKIGYNEYGAQIKALNDLSRSHNFKFKEVMT